MGRAKHISDYERGKIDALRNEGLDERTIAENIKRSKTLVHNYLSSKGKQRVKETRGRKKVIDQRARRAISRLASNSTMTAGKIKDELSLVASVRTIRRELRSIPTLERRKLRRKPKLTQAHKEARLNFAKRCIETRINWDDVVWSDEKKFNLDGPDGYQYYWHDLRKEERVLSRRNYGGGNVMVWAAFGSKGKASIAFITNRLDSEDYITMLETHLLPCIKKIGGKNAIFQQDGASIHRSMRTSEWLKSKKINVLSWPANSPDLNPMENLWALLVRKLYDNSRQFQNIKDLKEKLVECWQMITNEDLKKLIESMPRRIIETIQKKGNPTHY
jgi:predicted transcriptional regulator